MASVLGALPGCGGAVVVITAFARGNIRLGAMVAALIATMGDAAFLPIGEGANNLSKADGHFDFCCSNKRVDS